VTINTSKITEKLMPIPHPHLLRKIPRGYSASAPSSPSRTLRERKGKVNYKALHLGQTIKQDIQHAAQDVKEKCKMMRKSERKSAKAAVTKPPPASVPSSPHPSSSSSSWNFWPSK
jgi:hypothetical protein